MSSQDNLKSRNQSWFVSMLYRQSIKTIIVVKENPDLIKWTFCIIDTYTDLKIYFANGINKITKTTLISKFPNGQRGESWIC